MSTKLVQRRGLHKRTYEIVADQVVLESQTLTTGWTTRYQIFDLADATERQFKRDWRWLAGAIVCALFSIPLVSDAIGLRAFFPLIGAALCWLGAGALWLQYLEKSYDNIIFVHGQTGNGVFVIWNNKPDKAACDDFCNTLLDKIRRTRVNPKLTTEQKLEVYGRHLALHVQENVLSADEARTFFERKEKAFAREKATVVSIVPGQA